MLVHLDYSRPLLLLAPLPLIGIDLDAGHHRTARQRLSALIAPTA
jgi:hypothetical protein